MSAVAEADPRVGQILLDRYHIDEVLGRGGFGVVYAATDLIESMDVAVKVFQPGKDASRMRSARARFEREAQTLASLRHPNLVRFYGYDVLGDDSPAIVMERIRGVNLRRMLGEVAFSPEQITRVLRQAASALATCHGHGLVHRDLKPENLLIDARDPRNLLVKIIDFGLSKLLGGGQDMTALTMAGQLFGSPRYMAPEQWRGQTVDGRADIYALGLIGYSMVLGHPPIRGKQPVRIFQSHMSPRPRITQCVDGTVVPVELADVIERAARVEVSERFATAREMVAALEVQGDAPLPEVSADLIQEGMSLGSIDFEPYEVDEVTRATDGFLEDDEPTEMEADVHPQALKLPPGEDWMARARRLANAEPTDAASSSVEISADAYEGVVEEGDPTRLDGDYAGLADVPGPASLAGPATVRDPRHPEPAHQPTLMMTPQGTNTLPPRAGRPQARKMPAWVTGVAGLFGGAIVGAAILGALLYFLIR